MHKESHRLQEHAAYEIQVAMALGRRQHNRKHMQTDSDTDEGAKDSDDDPYPTYDVSTRELCEQLAAGPPPQAKQGRPPVKPQNGDDATLELAAFRPSLGGVAALRLLLQARADPNIEPTAGSLSPLRRVITYAPSSEVVEMRQLLLEHGAKESKDDKRRWSERCGVDKHEATWLMNFHRDDRRGFDPSVSR